MFKAEKRTPPQKVLIASANPLFGRGLERLITRRWGDGHIQIRLASEMSETLSILTEWGPDLVIVDYDDRNINRAEFLSHFVAGEKPMQVMMVSLQASGAVVVYDRRTLTPAQAEDWLDLQWLSPQTAEMDHSMPKRSSNMKHFVIVGVLVVVLTLVVNAILTGIGILPVEAATQAAVIDRLFNLHFFFIAFLFSLIAVFLMYSVVVWRKKAGSSDEGANFSGSNRLEIAWTVFPLAAVRVVC
ncbi:MAG: cytochrome c oxidase subunit II transmembrane domain-containing protein, partial [Anaerolineaceae bacterium]|nr:cytochrome c oxidase subunit II transmembrane domain-containing protein [Anaerolineaceae bacterium]